MSFFAKVGKFVKSTGGAPAAQAITGLGFQPKVLIFWTAGCTVDGTIQTQATSDARVCIGIASGTLAADQFAVSTTADTAGGGGRRVTQKSLLLVDAAGATVVSEASLASFDSDGFTLTWSTNSVTEAQIIHYLALGGTDVQAKVLSFLSPAGTGNFATTGAGFQPNVLMSIGSITGSALDTASGNAVLRVGAGMSSSNRWAIAMFTAQAVSSPAWRWHRNDRFVESVQGTGVSNGEMDIVSLDADGFTLNETVAQAIRVGVLCLKVPGAAVGTFTKPVGGGPAAGSVSGFGFVPSVVLLASDQDVNRANASSQTGARLGISAFTGSGAESSVISVADVANPVAFAYLEKTAKAAVKINNATPVIDAEATGTLDSDGFTLTWNANDAVATEFGYIALGIIPDYRTRPSMGQVKRPRANAGRKQRGAFLRRTA